MDKTKMLKAFADAADAATQKNARDFAALMEIYSDEERPTLQEGATLGSFFAGQMTARMECAGIMAAILAKVE